MGCSPWGLEELDTTERFHFHFPALEKEMVTHSSITQMSSGYERDHHGLACLLLGQMNSALAKMRTISPHL